MKRKIYWCLIFLALAATSSLRSAEISGTVVSAADKYATVTSNSDLIPIPGDKVEIFFKLPAADEEISVANGHVYEITGSMIMVEIDKKTGDVRKDQLVRITSANPQARPARTSLPPQQSSPVAIARPQTQTTTEPPTIGQMAADVITFDEIGLGAIPAEAFAARGVHLVKGNGAPGIYDAVTNMVLPRPCKHVLLVAGDRTTSLTITFASPIRRFVLSRIGTAGGASIPTWTMKAYNGKGKLVGSTGEQHGLPAMPQEFSIQGPEIARVELTTDNRYGDATWATWNSLPVAAIGFDR